MKHFFDTSALIKNYIEETGSEQVSHLMDDAAKMENLVTFNLVV